MSNQVEIKQRSINVLTLVDAGRENGDPQARGKRQDDATVEGAVTVLGRWGS